MPFPKGNNKQTNFLHALAGDKKKGIMPPSQALAAPMAGGINPIMPAVPGPNPMINPAPIPVQHMPQPAMPRMQPQTSLHPTAVPSLPGTPQLPKFGKTRNSLRGNPFIKSNKI